MIAICFSISVFLNEKQLTKMYTNPNVLSFANKLIFINQTFWITLLHLSPQEIPLEVEEQQNGYTLLLVILSVFLVGTLISILVFLIACRRCCQGGRFCLRWKITFFRSRCSSFDLILFIFYQFVCSPGLELWAWKKMWEQQWVLIKGEDVINAAAV